LGMPDLQFKVDLSPKTQIDSSGMDNVVFLFSANKHGKLNPVSQTASGGEISRLMLGLKSLIAGETALPTIIFDEIDTGVSGETADKLGAILHEMGKVMQVISITHLPQIAARGDSQFFVFKEDKGNKTETGIRLLNKEERVTEIAHLLSGSEVTKASLENAKELLKAKTGKSMDNNPQG
jgi:ATPase involved in DNA repair